MVQKPIIPSLEDSVSTMRYIGPYLAEKLDNAGILTIGDLVEFLENFSDGNQDSVEVRWQVRDWLREVLENERPAQCVISRSRNVNGDMYFTRKTNQEAYNAIIRLWRAYVYGPARLWIPYRFRERLFQTKYPPRCRI